MRTIKTAAFQLFCILLIGTAYASNSDYAAKPPFLPTPVSPNILFVVDKSGSMSWYAYYTTGTTTTAAVEPFDNTAEYEGYFTPAENYKISGITWQVTPDANTCTLSHDAVPWYTDGNGDQVYLHYYYPSGVCSGNELNFAIMRRVDLLRWAVTGGRPDGCTGIANDTCDPDLVCTGATCTLTTHWGFKVEVDTASRINGITQIFSDQEFRPRFGLLFYGNGIESDKVYIGDYPNDNNAKSGSTTPYSYINQFINYMQPTGNTATSPALWEAYDYFKQSNDHSYTNGFAMAGKNSDKHRDPLYVCDYKKNNCELIACAKNFVILATDGQWNVGGTGLSSTCTIDTGYEDDSADPVVPAYKMHYDLLRSVTSDSGTTYDKRVDTVFGLGMFLQGTGVTSLENITMYGGYNTQGGLDQWPDSLTGYPSATCVMDDCGSGKGSACVALPATTSPPAIAPDWDSDQDGAPDAFANASSASELKDSIKELIDDATQQAAAGSSLSVLSKRATSGSVLHQALFYPTRSFNTIYDVEWTGALNAYWFFNTSNVNNIREDNANALYLDTEADNVIDFRISSSGALAIDYYDTDSTGAKNNQLGTYSDVTSIHKVFESGEKLRDRAASNRVIYGVDESDTRTLFTDTNYTDFDTLLDPSSGLSGTDFDACLGNSSQTRSENVINYIRGGADAFTANGGTGDCRSRIVNGSNDKWKLGDIIHSTPALVEYTDFSMIYVSSNDGMLHAFEAGAIRTDSLTADQKVRLCENKTGSCFDGANDVTTNDIGKEAWAFIPKNTMPYLKYIGDPDYEHIYTVDLAPYHIKHGSKEIIIGGMRFGGATGCTSGGSWCGDPSNDLQVVPPDCSAGSPDCLGLSSYFALDVTDPDDPKFLWEFSDPGLGFSYTGPAYITMGSDHYVMFANGPINYTGDIDNQDLRYFILKVDSDFKLVDVNSDTNIDKDDIFKIAGASYTGYATDSGLSSFNQTFGGRLFTTGLDWNNDNYTDIVFMGVNRKTGSTWSGNVMGIAPVSTGTGLAQYNDPTDKKDNPVGGETMNWSFNKVFNSAQSPVTAKVVHGECFGNQMIYFGTGRWFFKDDEPGQNINDVEALHAIKITECLNDLAAGHTCNMNFAHSAHFACADITDPRMGWTIDSDLEPKDGNYNKERTITDPSFSDDNMIFFTTMQPSENPCDFGGRTRIWALNCMSGDDLWSGCPDYTVDIPDGSLLLQLSGGNIEDSQLDKSVFSEEDNRTTGWMTGIPPESSTPFVPYSGMLNGEIILWIER